MDIEEIRPWTADKPVTSPFVLPQGIRGRLAGWFMRWTNRQEDVARLLAVRPGDQVLEIGYGPGTLIGLLASRIGTGRVYGVDPSAEMRDLATAQNRTAIHANRVDLRLGTAGATGFPDAMFDHVVSVNNVALWPDLEAGLWELHRITRPGGVVLIAWHGGTTPARLTRRFTLDEKFLAMIHDGLEERFAGVGRHELRTLTAFRGIR
jgi:ubiquinone/menaquinone biosynthesis C-methylase UbiE